MNTRELVDQSAKPTVEARQRQILEETGHPNIGNGIIEAGRLPSDGAGKPSFARSRLSGQDQVLMGFEPFALCQGEKLSAVKTAMGGEDRAVATAFQRACALSAPFLFVANV